MVCCAVLCGEKTTLDDQERPAIMRHTRISTIIFVTLLAVAVTAHVAERRAIRQPRDQPRRAPGQRRRDLRRGHQPGDAQHLRPVHLAAARSAARGASSSRWRPNGSSNRNSSPRRDGKPASNRTSSRWPKWPRTSKNRPVGSTNSINLLAAMGTDRDHLLDIIREMDIVRSFIKDEDRSHHHGD